MKLNNNSIFILNEIRLLKDIPKRDLTHRELDYVEKQQTTVCFSESLQSYQPKYYFKDRFLIFE